MFSFNSPYGACPTCDGLGTRLEFDPDLIIPDKDLSLREGAVDVWRRGGRRMAIYFHYVLQEFCRDFNVDPEKPYRDLPKEIARHAPPRRAASGAAQEFEGVIPNCTRRFHKTTSEYVKSRLLEYMSELPCPACNGARLRPESLAVRVGGKAIHEVAAPLHHRGARLLQHRSRSTARRRSIAAQILKEIRQRLAFMVDVGIGYLTLDRMSSTLAGGEAQRIRLATQVGSGLVGVCYVLDEPTIGLHQRDNQRLLDTLVRLRDIGNTVIVVEHDEEAIRTADEIIDLGPGAGAHGGEIVAQGTLEDILAAPASLTGAYLSGRLSIPVPEHRRTPDLKEMRPGPRRAREQPEVARRRLPARLLRLRHRRQRLRQEHARHADPLSARWRAGSTTAASAPASTTSIIGANRMDKVIEIDQSPIGRTPRSNPATYTKLFDLVRQVFALTKEAKIRGYQPGRFSFNVKGGRCEACQGQGTKMIEMHFLPDVFVTCEECKGRRYNQETLEIRFKGLNIAEVLDLRVDEALELFANFPAIKRVVQTLADVGLGYVALGQSSTTLSGGEAQRIKLAAELGKRATGSTLYILDEPTTGLHFADINRLLDVLNRLVDMGNTVVVIEHNLDVIKTADYIIDLGPEGGAAGGEIVATGSPEQIAAQRALLHRPVPQAGPTTRGVERGGRVKASTTRKDFHRPRPHPRTV